MAVRIVPHQLDVAARVSLCSYPEKGDLLEKTPLAIGPLPGNNAKALLTLWLQILLLLDPGGIDFQEGMLRAFRDQALHSGRLSRQGLSGSGPGHPEDQAEGQHRSDRLPICKAVLDNHAASSSTPATPHISSQSPPSPVRRQRRRLLFTDRKSV